MSRFDEMAKNFDTKDRIERAAAIAEEMRCHLAGGQYESAMEFGCGTGLVGLNLLDEFGTMLFVDSSSGMLEQLSKKLETLDNANVSVLCGDFTQDVPPPLRFDCIFSSLTLHHIEDTQGILARLCGMLNDGGRLLVVELDADEGEFHAENKGFEKHNGFEQQALIETVKAAGFSQASARTFYHGVKTVNGVESPYSFFTLVAEK